MSTFQETEPLKKNKLLKPNQYCMRQLNIKDALWQKTRETVLAVSVWSPFALAMTSGLEDALNRSETLQDEGRSSQLKQLSHCDCCASQE